MRVALKILALVVAMVVAVLAVEAVVQSQRESTLYQQDLRRDQRVLGRALREVAERTWHDRGIEATYQILEAAASGEREVGVALIDAAATDAAMAAGSDDGVHDVDLVQFESPQAGGSLVTVIPIQGPNGTRMGLELATPLVDQRAYLARGMRRIGFLAIILLLTTSALTLTAGARFVGRPVGALARQAQALADGNFVHSNLTQRDEIGALGRALDQTADELARAQRTIEKVTHERVAAVERLRHADRLVTVGTLAAGVAHELGTPLHVIEGRAQRILRASDEGPVREEASIIVNQCQSVQEIVRDLLGFARPDRAERSRVCLDVLTRELASVLEPLIRRHHAELVLDLQPVDIWGAAGPLQQVLSNLLINAAQASPEGGEIKVSVDPPSIELDRELPDELREQGPKKFCRIRVRDEGSGMDPETRERIYDPFFTTKEPGEGTGLGLSIAYGIVREHGGRLEVSSVPGRGSVFEIWLPVRAEEL